jgi:CRISPR system Cascade subunit CasA
VNLLTEAWMPVRRRDGSREWVTPSQLARPELLAFDADRADFNGVLAQFAIGLLQTTTPVERHSEWRALLAEPPGEQTLAKWFAPVKAAFAFDGDGARFMQDPVLVSTAGESHCVAGLLLDTASENAIPQNKDLWVKRHSRQAMCKACTASAIFHMQSIAPQGGGGGGGKFVGIRGGGPLTTLLIAHPRRTLWHDLWLNVMEQSEFANLPGEKQAGSIEHTFPWMREWNLPAGARKELTPTDMAPAHVLWAMPRRLRIDFDDAASGVCDVCHRETTHLVRSYRDTTGGLHYKRQDLWNHPLSPYRDLGKEGWQAIRQHGQLGYRDWLGMVVATGNGSMRRAKVIEHCFTRRIRETPGQLVVWAFGYDLDQGKAVAWHDSKVPLYGMNDLDTKAQAQIEAEVGRWLTTASDAARCLVRAIRDAWFKAERAPKKTEEKANFTAIDAAFLGSTESRFYRQLEELIQRARDNDEFDAIAVNTNWLKHLQAVATSLFDHEFVGTGPIDQEQPRRIAEAYQQLQRNLHGPKLREALGLRVDQPPGDKPKAKRAAKTKEVTP